MALDSLCDTLSLLATVCLPGLNLGQKMTVSIHCRRDANFQTNKGLADRHCLFQSVSFPDTFVLLQSALYCVKHSQSQLTTFLTLQGVPICEVEAPPLHCVYLSRPCTESLNLQELVVKRKG